MKILAISAVAMFSGIAARILSVAARVGYLSNGVTDIRDRMMKSILSRPMRLFRERDDSYYLNLLGEDTELYRNNRLNMVPYMFSAFVSVAANAGMLFFLHPVLFLVGVVASVIPLLTANLFTKATQEKRNLVSRTAENYTGILKEGIEGYETLRFSKGQEPFLSRFSSASRQKAKAQGESALINTLSFMSLLAAGGIAQIVCLGIAGYLSTLGLVTVAALYAAVIYVNNLSNALSNMMEYVIDFRASRPLAEKLKSEAGAPCPVDGGLTPARDQGLVYEKVSFGFGERQLYSGLSCSFAPGGCYAILGESGSGKSTLTRLLLKYYDNYEGNILLANRDIRELSEDEIYRIVGLVSQSPFLFNASLYDNITMFTNEPPRDSAEYEKLLADLNLTALAGRVGDAPLGDFGDNISGGERQRINIARTLRSRPSILIFDEPTTGLDPENVALIDQFIFDRTDVTRIVITHNWTEDYLARFDSVLRIGK